MCTQWKYEFVTRDVALNMNTLRKLSRFFDNIVIINYANSDNFKQGMPAFISIDIVINARYAFLLLRHKPHGTIV